MQKPVIQNFTIIDLIFSLSFFFWHICSQRMSQK